jgi:hypothetical protein
MSNDLNQLQYSQSFQPSEGWKLSFLVLEFSKSLSNPMSHFRKVSLFFGIGRGEEKL